MSVRDIEPENKPGTAAMLRAARDSGIQAALNRLGSHYSVYTALVTRMPNIHPSLAKIADDAGVSRASAVRIVNDLECTDLIERDRRTGGKYFNDTTRYHLADITSQALAADIVERLGGIAGKRRSARKTRGANESRCTGDAGVVSPAHRPSLTGGPNLVSPASHKGTSKSISKSENQLTTLGGDVKPAEAEACASGDQLPLPGVDMRATQENEKEIFATFKCADGQVTISKGRVEKWREDFPHINVDVELLGWAEWTQSVELKMGAAAMWAMIRRKIREKEATEPLGRDQEGNRIVALYDDGSSPLPKDYPSAAYIDEVLASISTPQEMAEGGRHPDGTPMSAEEVERHCGATSRQAG